MTNLQPSNLPTFQLGLIGFPLRHSLSPKIHKAALESCGLQGDYSLFPIPPDDFHGLKQLLSRIRNEELTGLNVTIPHKQNVIQFLDDLTPAAIVIGAVNTIYLRDNKLIGDNTDAAGFLSDLKRFLTTETRRHGDSNALVLGAGGSSRAIVYALLHDGWKVTVSARRIEQAQQLANFFTQHELRIMALTDLRYLTFDLLVNTTPLGMSPNTDQSPWPENLPLPKAAVYDLIYNPRETKLIKDARTQGLSATTGLGMLVEQAALAFELWTGRNPPRNILFESVGHLP